MFGTSRLGDRSFLLFPDAYSVNLCATTHTFVSLGRGEGGVWGLRGRVSVYSLFRVT